MDQVFLTTPGKQNQWFAREACTLNFERPLGGFVHRLYHTRHGAWVQEQQRPKNSTLVEVVEAPAARTWLINMGFWDGLSEEARVRLDSEVARFEI